VARSTLDVDGGHGSVRVDVQAAEGPGPSARRRRAPSGNRERRYEQHGGARGRRRRTAGGAVPVPSAVPAEGPGVEPTSSTAGRGGGGSGVAPPAAAARRGFLPRIARRARGREDHVLAGRGAPGAFSTGSAAGGPPGRAPAPGPRSGTRAARPAARHRRRARSPGALRRRSEPGSTGATGAFCAPSTTKEVSTPGSSGSGSARVARARRAAPRTRAPRRAPRGAAEARGVPAQGLLLCHTGSRPSLSTDERGARRAGSQRLRPGSPCV
jgi:hypothetical protein